VVAIFGINGSHDTAREIYLSSTTAEGVTPRRMCRLVVKRLLSFVANAATQRQPLYWGPVASSPCRPRQPDSRSGPLHMESAGTTPLLHGESTPTSR